MSLLSENVIPGDHGKVFETNAKDEQDQVRISKAVLGVEGVKDVQWTADSFPRECTVHTTDMVEVDKIQQSVTSMGFHLIPKHHFPI